MAVKHQKKERKKDEEKKVWSMESFQYNYNLCLLCTFFKVRDIKYECLAIKKKLNWKAQHVLLFTDDSLPWPHTHAHKPRQWTAPCTDCSLNSSFMHHLSQFVTKTYSSVLVTEDTHAIISACRCSEVTSTHTHTYTHIHTHTGRCRGEL